jgi:hypothetical protein
VLGYGRLTTPGVDAAVSALAEALRDAERRH